MSKCVQDALEIYLHNMQDHEFTNLYQLVIEEVERPLFETVVRHAEGNLTLAARMLGLTRSTLRKRLSHYAIDRVELRGSAPFGLTGHCRVPAQPTPSTP